MNKKLSGLLKRHGLWVFLTLSLILHITGVAPHVIQQLFPEQPAVELSEEARFALIEKEQAAIQLALLEQKKLTLHEQVKQQFESIAEHVDPELVKEMWEELEPEMSEGLESLEEMLEENDFESNEFNEQYLELSAEMFESTAEMLKKVLRKELLKEITEQVKTHTNPKLAKNLDRRMHEYHGNREEKRLTQAAQRDTAERRDKMSKVVSKVQQEMEALAKEQAALAESTKQLQAASNKDESQHKDLAKKQKQLQEKLNDASKSLDTMRKDMREQLPDTARKNKSLSSDKHLENAKKEQTSAQEAITQQQTSSKAMERAATEIKKTAQNLAQLQTALKKGPRVDELAKQALKKLIDEDIKQSIKKEFDKDLSERLAPRSAEKLLKQARRYLDDFNMHTDKELMESLDKAVKKELIKGVPENMQAAAEDLALKKTSERHGLDKVEESSQKLKLSNELSLRKKIVEELQNERNKDVQRQLDESLRSADLGDMSKVIEKLKAKLGMMQKAELMAKNLRDGRGESGEMGDFLSMMEMMGGENIEGEGGEGQDQGNGLPMGLGSGPGRGPGQGLYRDRQRVKAVKELQQKRSQPDAVYEDIQREADKLVSQSKPFPEKRSALLVQPQLIDEVSSDKKSENKRTIADPTFNPIRFGYASMARKSVVIDGTFDEWDLERPQYARFLYSKEGNETELPERDSVKFYMMWDHEAFYIALIVPNDEKYQTPTPGKFWDGDTVEVFMDTINNRAPLVNYVEASQMWFMPYATQTHPDIVGGYNHGYNIGARAYIGKDGRDTRRLTRTDKRLYHAHKEIPGGYQIEICIPQSTLHGPRFVAGKYLGMAMTCNDVRGRQDVCWSRRYPLGYQRPDKWGDVLLLGSDAEISFKKDAADEESLELFMPGEPLQICIHDPDMNIDPKFKDQLTVHAIGAHGVSQLVVLGETEIDSGKFVGGLDTHSAYVGHVDESLALEPGSALILQYLDQRRAYGESNEMIESTLQASWPLLKLGKTQ